MDGTSILGLTERHAAVHATGALRGQSVQVVGGVNFIKVRDTGDRVSIRSSFTLKFFESCRLTHVSRAVVRAAAKAVGWS